MNVNYIHQKLCYTSSATTYNGNFLKGKNINLKLWYRTKFEEAPHIASRGS